MSKLKFELTKEVDYIELDEVMRQEESSGILFNANRAGIIKDSFVTDFQFDVKKKILFG
jgi:hypothetical protein